RVSHAFAALLSPKLPTFAALPLCAFALSSCPSDPMKFAICNEIFKGWKLDDTLSYAKRLGYSAVEIAPFTLANSVTDISATERQKIRDSAARIGIEIAGIHWVLVKPEGLYINHADPAIRERTSHYFRELVDFCADIGGKVIVVGSPKQRNI